MAKYKHVVSGARVEVRDDKVMDSSWEPVDGDKKAPAKRTTAKAKSDEEK